MKGTRNLLLLGVALAGVGVVAYRLLLTDEARQALSSCAEEVCDVVKHVNDVFEGTQDNGMDAAAQARQTAKEWESLGY